jgi:hypothetical protein
MPHPFSITPRSRAHHALSKNYTASDRAIATSSTALQWGTKSRQHIACNVSNTSQSSGCSSSVQRERMKSRTIFNSAADVLLASPRRSGPSQSRG